MNVDPLAIAQRQFVIDTVQTPELAREAQALRYQVFNRERQIIVHQNDDGLDIDEYDARSRHVVLRRRDSGQPVGTARLVVGCRRTQRGSLPIHRYCPAPLLDSAPLRSTGEISRFALSKERRSPDCPSDSLLRLGLMRGILEVSGELGLTHWCAMMEASLLRLLARVGIRFRPVGPMVECYGRRQPAIAAIEEVLDRGGLTCPAHFRFVTSSPRVAAGRLAMAA